MNAIIILDNYLVQNIDMSKLFPHLTIKFSPPNVTNKHQSAETGTIAAFKVGYNSLFLRTLLGIFDTPVRYKESARLWSMH